MFISDNNPAAISLSAAASGAAVLPIGMEVTLQPFLPVGSSNIVLFRVTASATSAATDLTNASGAIAHGGTESFHTEPVKQMYLHWALVTAGGVTVTGGASDKIFVMVEA